MTNTAEIFDGSVDITVIPGHGGAGGFSHACACLLEDNKVILIGGTNSNGENLKTVNTNDLGIGGWSTAQGTLTLTELFLL